MKPASKLLFIALVGVFLLISCGPVTPVPSATPTATVTATATRRPTAMATATPTKTAPTPQPTVSTRLMEQLPPSQPVDQYELVPWSSELPRKMMKVFGDNGYDLWPSDYEWLDDFYWMSFTTETWFRSLSQTNEKEELCYLLIADPSSELIPNARPGQDVFSYVFEDLINRKGVAADKLVEFSDLADDLSQAYFSNPNCLARFVFHKTERFELKNSPLVVHNLFGDGQDAYVYQVSTISGDNRMALYAIHRIKNEWRVERVRDWIRPSILGWWYDVEFFEIGDPNGNSRAEFVVEYNARGSGEWHWQVDWLEWYEWNPVLGDFEIAKVTIFDQATYGFGSRREWEFTNQDGTSLLTVNTFSYYSNDSDYDFWLDKCIYFFSQQVYRFVNGSFDLVDSTPALPANSPICQIVWAYRVVSKPQGWKNDQAIRILSNALDNWPDEMNRLWGEASRDYLQLRMAVWHDFRGEKQRAIEILNSLKLKNEQALPSQLAGAYLVEREQKGLLAASVALNAAKYQAVGDDIPTGLSPIWGYATDNIVANDLKIDDFCDRGDVVMVAAKNSGVQSELGLKSWLSANGKQEIYTEELSINGRTLWLAGFLDRTYEQKVDRKKQTAYVYHLWAFTPAGNGLDALFVDAWRSYDEPANPDETNISFKLLQPTSNTYFLGVFSKYRFNVVRVYADGRLSIQLTGSSEEADFYFHDNQIEILSKEYSPWHWQVTTYQWNNNLQDFDEVNETIDFPTIQRKVERLIYREKNYSGAIVLINKFLNEAPPENVLPSFCYEYIAQNYDDSKTGLDPRVANCDLPPDVYHPYLRYLLGVAYEMAGQPELAKLTFYALWNEYPTNLFGVVASQRLAPIQP